MKIIINHKSYNITESELDFSLLLYLRETIKLTGIKNGCGIGSCGTCTVLVDQRPVLACKKKVRDVVGKEILSIEGLAPAEDQLHPLQQAFIDAGAIQCGFCTPAMVLRGHALLLADKNPDRDKIKRAIQPVLCRCTGYQQIVDAIEIAKEYY